MNYNRHITLDNSNIIVKYTNERIIPASGLAVVGALLGKSNFTKKLNHIDVTPMDNSKTSKQGVSRTYKGFDGYAPIMAYIGTEGYAVNFELREGKQHCQNGTVEFLLETISLCKKLTDKAWFRYRFKAQLNSEITLHKNKEINDIEQNKKLSIVEKEERIRDIEACYEENGGNDYYIDMQYESLVDFYIANKKGKQTNKLEDYLKKIKHIDEVVVLGHRMGNVDREYFELVEQYIRPVKWTISARDVNGINSVVSSCNTYSFRNKIHVKTMGEILGTNKSLWWFLACETVFWYLFNKNPVYGKKIKWKVAQFIEFVIL